MPHRNEVIKALEREMLWELDTAHSFDGWVVVGRQDNGRLQPLPWTFRLAKANALERLLYFATESHRHGIGWANGFPVNGNRTTQIRWIRRHGFWVQKAIIKAVE